MPAKKRAAKKPIPAKKEEKPQDDFSRAMQKLPKDAQKKLKDVKVKLDKLQSQVLAKFGDYVVGMALMPPAQQQQPAQGGALQQQNIAPQQQAPEQVKDKKGNDIDPKDLVNVLVLVDDSDSKKMSKQELSSKLSAIIAQMGKDIDEKIVTKTVIVSELLQNCFDAKPELNQMISMSAILYDKGMLSAIKITEIHKNMVLRKFERYIVSYVLAGSLIQGRANEKSDIDVFIVIDDTDVKRMTRAELKDKLRAIIIGMGLEAGELTGIKNKLNIQVYILTDFWDSIKEANPIIFTFLRDGVPLYDRGIFMPWKQLLQMGRIKPSPEAIDLYMNTGEQVLARVKAKMKEIGMEDVFWAILTPSQAAIMLYGVAPPTPKETPDVLREIFVKKEKIFEEEYVKILESHIKLRKDLEHGDVKELTGAQIDKYITNSDKYLKRLEKLFKQIQDMKEKENMAHVYDNVVTLIRDVLRLEKIEKVADVELVKVFENEMIATGKIPARFLRMLNDLVTAKKHYDSNKLTRAEVEKVRKDADSFSRHMIEYMQRKRARELERAKIRVKYGDKYGEVLLLQDKVYIVKDIDNEEKSVSQGVLGKDGSIAQVSSAKLQDFEKSLSSEVIPPQSFIKEKTFEALKQIFGPEVEILVNY